MRSGVNRREKARKCDQNRDGFETEAKFPLFFFFAGKEVFICSTRAPMMAGGRVADSPKTPTKENFNNIFYGKINLVLLF